LPNKRTALYDSYIELVFDRESEKNALIRDKRDLIIDIHQYLAWVLHSEAELLKNNGSIHLNKLNIQLKEYLANEGHDTTIADQLFDVMKERVCALISRVQGTFEFEVQPLREYFCAKYLYKSAPHSSAGSVKSGTKPDRLHAILRNFYWQNVVRFFAGCADAGELDMIIRELEELQNDSLLKNTNYPRIITSQILSDYVFTQKPLKLKDVVKIIVDGINIGNIINQDGRYGSKDPLLLPNECGRIEMIDECFQQLIKLPNSDYANELIGIINNNPLNNLDNWLKFTPKFKGIELTKWLEYAYKLQLIYKIQESFLQEILKEGDLLQTQKRIQIIINGNRFDIIDKDIELKQILFDGILNNELSIPERKNKEHSLHFLTLLLHPFVLSHLLHNEYRNLTLINYITHVFHGSMNPSNSLRSISEFAIADNIDKTVNKFKKSIKSILNLSIDRFKSSIEPWDQLVESGRVFFKDNWSLNIVATIAAGIKSKEETYDDYLNLHDNTLSLCKRVRCARMKSGNTKYWENQLAASTDLNFTLLIFFTWATPKVIIQLLFLVSNIIKALDLNDFETLSGGLSCTTNNSSFNNTQQKYIEKEIKDKKDIDEIKYLLSLRFDRNNGQSFIYNNIEKYNNILQNTLEIKFQYLINAFLKEPSDTDILEELKVTYRSINQYDFRHYSLYNKEQINLPYDIAKTIMEDCKNYPKIITVLAEKACRIYANEHLIAIGEIAKNEKWFDEN